MTFDKDTPEDDRSQVPKHLSQFCTNEISQKNTSDIWQESKTQFQTLIENTSALIFVIQAEKICYVNPIVELTIGYSRSQLAISRDFYYQLNPKGYRPDSFGQNYSNELKLKLKGAQECWLECWWKTIEWECQPAIMVTAVDVTEYKQVEVKTKQALIAEKELSQNKTKFVSMVSHEFRIPLNIISFSTSLLKRHLNQWNKAKQLKYLNRLQTAVCQLGSLMDEVLIIGRAEAGKLKFNPQSFDLTLFCHSLLAEINLSQPELAKINLINLVEHETIRADRNLLKLALMNLLGNAIKYSPADSTVEFTVRCDDELLIFEIADCGIGIPAEEQSKIFEPFHRSHNVGDFNGNGLGLAIALKTVELHGGQIILESEADVGTTFIVKIPFKSS